MSLARLPSAPFALLRSLADGPSNEGKAPLSADRRSTRAALSTAHSTGSATSPSTTTSDRPAAPWSKSKMVNFRVCPQAPLTAGFFDQVFVPCVKRADQPFPTPVSSPRRPSLALPCLILIALSALFSRPSCSFSSFRASHAISGPRGGAALFVVHGPSQ